MVRRRTRRDRTWAAAARAPTHRETWGQACFWFIPGVTWHMATWPWHMAVFSAPFLPSRGLHHDRELARHNHQRDVQHGRRLDVQLMLMPEFIDALGQLHGAGWSIGAEVNATGADLGHAIARSRPVRTTVKPRNRANRLCRWIAYQRCLTRSLVRRALVPSIVASSTLDASTNSQCSSRWLGRR